MDYKKWIYSAFCSSLLFAMPLCSQEDESEGDQSIENEEVNEEVNNGFNPARTTHEGSNHKYVGRTQYSDLIKLEDGSYWSVNPDQQGLLKEWLEGDPLAITQAPKKWLWGNNNLYPYVIYNRRTDEYISVKYATEPELHSFYRRYIVEINRGERNPFLVLNDNTVWPLDEKSRSTWESWVQGDVIIIGSNNVYLNWFNPNILINCNAGAPYIVAKRKR